MFKLHGVISIHFHYINIMAEYSLWSFHMIANDEGNQRYTGMTLENGRVSNFHHCHLSAQMRVVVLSTAMWLPWNMYLVVDETNGYRFLRCVIITGLYDFLYETNHKLNDYMISVSLCKTASWIKFQKGCPIIFRSLSNKMQQTIGGSITSIITLRVWCIDISIFVYSS